MKNLIDMPIGKLERILDSEVSLFIRKKYSDGESCRCYTCGMVMGIKEATCGHWISRRHRGTRWDVRFLRPQCSICQGRGGEQERFRERLVQEFGEELISEVENSKSNMALHSRVWLAEKIEYYRKIRMGD